MTVLLRPKTIGQLQPLKACVAPGAVMFHVFPGLTSYKASKPGFTLCVYFTL